MLVLSESASVDCCRPLHSKNKNNIGSDVTKEAVSGDVNDVRNIGSTSNSYSAEDHSKVRVLVEQQVTTMAAGPSRKGAGH
ncbi:hypothetical protein CCACVL1_26451 [Corchorus capsularis]|uniref:Uncharacterized protein n=1 Tax=Corchorus capsularis TaxID=210143 RepID=A0A1R3GER6_COCAP|nr:hypothetical protein CCACVL1_26451 [Corchorus capsularis]